MWFKQLQFFDLTNFTVNEAAMLEQLEALAFHPCLPTLPFTSGWVPPLGTDESPLIHVSQHYWLICLQVEEKILPSSVVNHHLQEKIKSVTEKRDYPVGRKERLTLKEDIIVSLLPKAFSRYKKIYAYIDNKQHKLCINSVASKDIELIINALKKCCSSFTIATPEIKKIDQLMTQWLLHQQYPDGFIIEKACVLQDPQQEARVIRAKQQDLSAQAIQSLIKDGCLVKQLAMTWQDAMSFALHEDGTIRQLRFKDQVLALAKESYSETPEERFASDFVIMTETVTNLLGELQSFLYRSPLDEQMVA